MQQVAMILSWVCQEADETATTTMTKDNNASVRFKDVVSSISSNLIVKIGEMCISLDQQFLTEERRIRLK